MACGASFDIAANNIHVGSYKLGLLLGSPVYVYGQENLILRLDGKKKKRKKERKKEQIRNSQRPDKETPNHIDLSSPVDRHTTTTSSMTEDVKTPAPEHAIGKLFVNIIEARNLNVSQPF
ncbi:hypothetical protein BC937DRAFT_92813 [Endogone sp. FLAS-F59071]|nr:hypothetical protein BC937DRAFT_92813 [Endogone sp. FLAS-F59071]|eukprot:RUS15164.1 hypothetical protein BC937DRAFT_92813 [Endogone sp. FLAS-F59071]